MNPALAVTLARLALAVPLAVLFHLPAPWATLGAGGVFVAAGLADALDGWLARRLGCATRLGAVLDPVADKVVTGTALVLLAADGRAPAAAAAVLIARDLLVGGLREALAGASPALAVTGLAKAKTALQFAAVALLLLAPGLPVPGAGEAGLALLWAAVALSVASGWGYARRAAAELRGAP